MGGAYMGPLRPLFSFVYMGLYGPYFLIVFEGLPHMLVGGGYHVIPRGVVGYVGYG